MIYLASLVATALLTVGLLHFAWAVRVYWPLGDEKALARAAVGTPGIVTMPPSYQSHLVAFCMVVAAADALFLAGVPGPIPGWLILAVGGGCCLVFLLRGAAGYSRVWARLTPEQPFRTFDKRYYSPLCLLLGAGFGVLLIAGR